MSAQVRSVDVIFYRRGRRSAVAVLAGVFTLLCLGVGEGRAVPSFARQTGEACTACHTAFPQLTPFGRAFKLNGYTMSNNSSMLPPVAAMIQGPTFTHTRADQASDDIPSHFHRNDNVSVNELSLFYAGRLFGPYADRLLPSQVANLLDKVGIFAQGTWNGVEHEYAWDNFEVRAANSTKVDGRNVVYGAYVNNNPTLQDLWNTTPAWGYPFSASELAPGPAAAPLIAGGLEQQVVGFGGYTKLADLLYLEMGAYSMLSASAQRSLGVDPEGQSQLDGLAPYWRIALEKDWGSHSLSGGTYGLAADTFPGRDHSAGTDSLTDVGMDVQYQYLSAEHDVTVMVNAIHEDQNWDASRLLGLANHGHDELWTATATASYLFHKTYGADIQYFYTNGSTDKLLYESRTGSPDSRGWVFQLDWLPLNRSEGPSFWPKSNVKVSAKYTHYDRFDGSHSNFDGSGRSASDNDTLYLQVWLAF